MQSMYDLASNPDAAFLFHELKKGDLTKEILLAYERKQQEVARLQMEQCQRVGGKRFHLQDGEQTLMVHKRSFHYWGQRLGYECWDCPQFRHEYARDVETSRIEGISPNAMVGYRAARDYTARRDQAGGIEIVHPITRRSRKVYA